MKFALGTPAIINYPAIMSSWEPSATGADIVRIAQQADDLGWDWMTISEHVVIPNDMAGVMGRRFPDSLTAAAVLAGATRRIKFLTYVLVLPYRNPVVLAKSISTLDFLSGGRLGLGTGGGHLQKEFEAIGVSFADRGKLTDEYIRAMKELWTSDNPSFDGQFVKFSGIAFEPKPVQKPHPPIFVGGNSKPAMRRAARFGDGWLPWLVTREQLPGCLDYIRSQPGFDASKHFEVAMPMIIPNVEDYSHRELGATREPGNREEILEEVGRMKEAGVTLVQVVPPKTASVSQAIEWIDWFAREIFPAFRR